MIRRALVGTHSAYVRVETIIVSLWHVAWGSVLLWIAYLVGSSAFDGGSPFWQCVSVAIGVWGCRKILKALPGITPSMPIGMPGQSRTARLRDLKRSGIFRGD
jgi:hypothetical protein